MKKDAQPLSRRRMLQLSGTVALAGLVPGLVRGQSALKARVAWQSSAQTASYLYAHTTGALKAQGLEVEHLKFSAGPPIFAGLRSESIDIAFFAETPASIALAQGIPVKVISVAADYGGAMGLVAAKDSGIKKIADLRGRKVAVVRGSAAHFTLGAILKQHGMTFGDVQMMAVDITNLIPAFQNRDVDAALYWEPWMSRLVQAGGTVLITNWEAKQPSATMWMARSRWLEQNEAAAVAFVRGLDSVVGDLRSHPARVAATISPELGLDANALTAILSRGARFPSAREMIDPGYVYSMAPQVVSAEQGLAGVLKEVGTFMKDLGVVPRVPDVKNSFYPNAVQATARSKA
jgi:sulfonate transport system substrate-binding protein